MKTLTRLVLVSVFMMFTAPAWAEALQLYNCEQHDDVDTSQVFAMAAKWHKAAKMVKGGENMRVFIRHPVAAATDDIDFVFVVSMPTFAEWGTFTENYEGSPASDLDDEIDEMVDCGDSTLWEGAEIK